MINGMVTSVWSSYGHRFMSTDKEMEDSCLTCGAVYRLVLTPEEFSDADYRTSDGDQPIECTGLTDIEHGSEQHCQNDNGRSCEAFQETGVCVHQASEHGCNCVLCM